MSKRYSTLLAVFLLLNFATCIHAEDNEPIDEALLEDLGAELLVPVPKKATSKIDQPLDQQPLDQQLLDQQLLEQLGEDLGEQRAAKNDWLTQVVDHMQTAQTLLQRTDSPGSASSAQAEALTGLDAMIAELTERQSQCKGGQCKGGQCKKPGSSKKGSSGKAGKSPAKGASASTNSGADLSTELAVAGDLVRDLWGKLPERQRQQILQPLSEEFLPKYASEIEAYFRALADPRRNAIESQ